jgi:LAS superfamily LD-carboxypeptidase LdcB
VIRTARRIAVVGLLVVSLTVGRHALAQTFGHAARDAGGPIGTAPPAVVPTAEAPARAATPTGATGLTPALRRAITRAMVAAAEDGVDLRITSGWRSRAEQERLYEQAIERYGSPEQARRWVLPPGQSAHVKGAAVDVGPRAGAQWLELHGVRYGLCRRYDNEWWHFELLAPQLGSTCPSREPNAGG